MIGRNVRRVIGIALAAGLAALEALPAAQDAGVRPAQPYTVLSREGRRALPGFTNGGTDMVALGDLAALFQLSVQEDALGLTVGYQGRTIVLSPGRSLASVGGRLISLATAPVRDRQTWLVPVDFIDRALGAVYDARLEVRRPSRLLIVGDLRVPRAVVRYEDLGTLARITVDLTPRGGPAVAQEPGRLAIRIEGDGLDASIPGVEPGPLVQGIQAGDGSQGLVVLLGPRFGTYRTALSGDSGSGRLTIEVVPASAETAGPVTAPGATTEPAPSLEPEGEPLLETAPGPVVRTIVIDAGHGGEEAGATGQAGTLEKTITLGVARRLKALIEGRLGLRVLMTRDGDQTVGLDARASLANNNKADLFISLHANASPAAGVSGAEVYYLGLAEYGEAALRAAEHQASVVPVYGGGTRAIDVIPWELAQAPHLEESAVFARIAESELRARVPMSRRSLQQGPFRALVGTNMAAILVEMGFLTNPEQERQLASDAFQATVAQALVQAIAQFREQVEQPRTAGPAADDPARVMPASRR